MKLNYTITMQHLVDFNLYHADHSKHMRIVRFLLLISLPVIMGLFTLYIIMTRMFNPVLIAVPAVVSIAWVIIFPAYFRRSFSKSVRKLYAEGKNSELLTEHTLSIANGKLVEETPFSRTEQAIERIEKVVETPEYVFIYLNALAAHVIPRSEIADAKLLEDFIAELKK